MKHAPRAERLPRHLGRPAHGRPRRHDGARRRLGAPPPRPRRADLHRPARPLGHRPARLPPRDRARGARARRTRLRSEDVISARGTVVAARRGERQPEPADRRDRAGRSPSSSSSPTPRRRRSRSTRTAPVDETLRLRYRSLDLRRARMQRRDRAAPPGRSRRCATSSNERDFLEIETPYPHALDAGGRARLPRARRGSQPGSFYALPQSPQLFKQLLMIGGFERYYQIARCFRDEDTRADRQPEFTQLDLEMSFVDEDDVIELMEAVMGAVFARERLRRPAAAVAADDLRRGDARATASTAPTRASGSRSHDLGDALAGTEFKVFAGALASGGVVRGINAGRARAAALGARRADRAGQAARRQGPVWAFVQEDGAGARRSPSSSSRARSPAVNAQRSSAHAGRPAADRGRRGRDRRPGARRAADGAGAALRPDPGRPPRHPLGGRLPDVLLGRRRAALGRRSPPVHRAASGDLDGPGRPGARAPTTSSSTAPRSAAARSASTASTSSSACSSCSGSAPRRRRRGSASCSTRSATARRRTAASRWASTGSSRCSPAATRSAT